MKFQPTRIALLVSGLFLAAGAHAQSTTDVGTINVQGAPGGTDTGLIQPEDSPKSRSSITQDFIKKAGPAVNPEMLINNLPGVNAYGQDATGLFGGNIRVRGFNSDQIGLTINGAPVNDSGNFAVFPQEYTDPENLCSIFVTQGSTDTDAPHVGASGGNLGIQSCSPKDVMGAQITSTFGSDSYRRNFIRADSGKFLYDMVKLYVSQSHAEADKFRGQGGANRDHTDFGARLDLGKGSYIEGNWLYNRAINNNYRALTKADIAREGYYTDFQTIAPVHATPVGGTAQNDTTLAANTANNITTAPPGTTTTTNTADGYYGYQLNPFKNYIGSITGHWQITPTMSAEFNPYMWYGYGTGGNELQNATESTGGNRLHGGVKDFNGDGDTLDTQYFYNGSTTKTYRPGFTVKYNWTIGNNQIQAAYWYEKARHQQQGPYIPIDSSGHVPDLWEANQALWIRQADGQPFQFRDWYTVNKAKSPSIQDTISLFDDKLTITPGIRHTDLDRNFTNSANGGTAAGADYHIEREYAKTLPSLSVAYHFTPEQQVYVNGAKNFRAPNNTSLSGLVTPVGGTATFVNGVQTNYTIRDPDVVAETSWNYDVGYRLATDRFTFSGSVYYINYKNRIATAFDPNTNISTDFNVGGSTSKGVDLEGAVKITNQISLYSSASYLTSKINSNFPFSATQTIPTAGKQYAATPHWMYSANLQYSTGPYYAFVNAKYTGKEYTTLINDESVPGYTLVNLGTGYTFPNMGWFKNPTISANIFNLFSKKYLSPSIGSGNSFKLNTSPVLNPNGTVLKTADTAVLYYVGSPITFTTTFGVQF